jgi:hypothetical protein
MITRRGEAERAATLLGRALQICKLCDGDASNLLITNPRNNKPRSNG